MAGRSFYRDLGLPLGLFAGFGIAVHVPELRNCPSWNCPEWRIVVAEQPAAFRSLILMGPLLS